MTKLLGNQNKNRPDNIEAVGKVIGHLVYLGFISDAQRNFKSPSAAHLSAATNGCTHMHIIH